MSTFEFVFKIEPSGDFGLPVPAVVVTKASERTELYGPGIDTVTGNVISHSSLSTYRNDAEAIHLEEHIGNLQLHLHDNFLRIRIREDDYMTAAKTVLSSVDRFIELLSLNRNAYFQAQLVQATGEIGGEHRGVQQPKTMPFAFHVYNLDAFKASLSWVFSTVPFTADRKLAKALDYFNHAQLLSNSLRALPWGDTKARGYLTADIFSNLYKAASVIVGDPSKDQDWQTRYKRIGLSYEFWKQKVEHVRTFRNTYGVAHYDLDDKQLDQELAGAVETAKTVIDQYITFLKLFKTTSGVGSPV